MLLKCVERVSMGDHSIGQVTAGCTIGVLVTIYSEFTPQVSHPPFYVMMSSLTSAVAVFRVCGPSRGNSDWCGGILFRHIAALSQGRYEQYPQLVSVGHGFQSVPVCSLAAPLPTPGMARLIAKSLRFALSSRGGRHRRREAGLERVHVR